ncbi:MAG: heparinase II/III domain-containing protein [Candidatus Helarchaeota archaeon]
MKKSWKLVIIVIVHSLLIFTNTSLIIGFESEFPDNGGFTRHIIYIKPSNGAYGYYIVMDELIGNVNSRWVDVVYHGRGSLKANISERSAIWSVKSYLNASQNVSLYLKYITPIEGMESKVGLFTHYGAIYEEIPYIKVRPKSSLKISSAILYPINNTMGFPMINEGENYFWINNTDFIMVQDNCMNVTIGDIITDAKVLFFRKNETGSIIDFLMLEGSHLIYNSTIYFNSNNPQTIIWHNGELKYSKIEIQEKYTSSHVFEPDMNITHPFLYYNKTEFDSIKQRVLTSSPWKEWHNELVSKASGILGKNISEMTPPERADNAILMAFLSQTKNNSEYLNKTRDLLDAINGVSDYTGDAEHLRRSIAMMKYIIAYDMIYQNLSISERDDYKQYIYDATKILYDTFETTPKNNHIVIRSGAIGLVGLVCNEKVWVQTAVDAIDRYLNVNIRSEGGCYEGQGYSGYGFMNVMRFIYALKNFGINYFQDPNFQKVFEFNMNCTSPLGTIPIFEDTRRNPEVAEMCLWVSPHIPSGGYLKWLYERRNNYSGIFSMFQPSVSRLIIYNKNITSQQPNWTMTNVYQDSGLSIFRSGWSPNAQYLTISCKSYIQSHTHLDENSIELWAYGAYLLANPGYGTFGDDHHRWLTSTEASNTILINNHDQFRETADGFKNFIKSENIEYISSQASNIYNHPSSFTSHPGIFNIFIFNYIVFAFSLTVSLIFIIKKIPNSKNSEIKKNNQSQLEILKNIILLDSKIYSQINNLNIKKLNLILLSVVLSFIILFSYIFIDMFYTSINPFLNSYYTPSSGYYNLISIIFILEVILLILIGPLIVLIVLLIRKVFYFCLKLQFRLSFLLKMDNKWNFKNMEYLSIPILMLINIVSFYFILNWYPIFQSYLDEALTNTGSMEHVVELLVNLSAFTIRNGIMLSIIAIPACIWGIYALILHINQVISKPKKFIAIELIKLILLLLGCFLLISLIIYYFGISWIGSLHMSDILS